MTDFDRSSKRDDAATAPEVRAAPPAVAHQSSGPRPVSRRAAAVHTGLRVGRADDAVEREADQVADGAVRLLRSHAPGTDHRAGSASESNVRRVQRSGRPPIEPARDVASPPRIQRTPLTISHTDPTPTIRRKIGNAGDPLIGRKVRKVGDTAGEVGTIKSWSSGGGLWGVTAALNLSNVVYVVEFASGSQSISAGDAAYELVPVDASATTTNATNATNTTASTAPTVASSRDASKDAETIAALEALIVRLGRPLIDLPGANGASHKDRKQLLTRLQTLRKKDDVDAMSSSLSEDTKAVEKVEREFKADIVAKNKERTDREKAKEDERQRLADEQHETERLSGVDEKNKQRCGKSVGQFRTQVPDADQLADFLRLTPRGQEGHLLTCLQRYELSGLKTLFEGGIAPEPANKLLALITDKPVAQLTTLLGHIQPGEYEHLAVLLGRTAPDKAGLVALLTKLGNSAKAAAAVMANAGAGTEASVLAMLDGGRSATETASLLDTTSGRTDTAGAATISAGVADVDTARILLDQPGVSGSAAEALGVLAHPLVANDIAKATPLLDKQGNAGDALALLRHGCSLVVAAQLLATDGIVGQGADAVWCLAQGCASADLVELLKVRSAQKIRSYRAAGHNFAFLKSELALNAKQEFWAGETCTAPAFSPPAVSLDGIIAVAAHPPAVGGYSGGNRFGNHGRLDDQGRPVMFLPPGNYREYDLKPFSTPSERGQRRIVVGGGHRYYTADHYATFQRFA